MRQNFHTCAPRTWKEKRGKKKKGERKRGGGRGREGERKKKKEEKKRSFTLLSVAKHSLIPQVFPNIVPDQILKIFLQTLNQNMNLKVVCGISITCSPGVSGCVTFQCSRFKPASTPILSCQFQNWSQIAWASVMHHFWGVVWFSLHFSWHIP